MKYLALTAPDGSSIWVLVSAVVRISPSLDHPGMTDLDLMNGQRQTVKEDQHALVGTLGGEE